MKVQVNRASKNVFLTLNEQQQQQQQQQKTGSAWNFLQPSKQVCKGVLTPFQDNAHFLLPPLFWKISQPSGKDGKQNGTQT